jgi:hypothetical protein
MAPNVKRNIPTLHTVSIVHPKDLLHVAPVVQAAQVDSASYWDWTSPEEPKEIEVSKAPVDLFSAAHYEANLIQAAAQMNESSSFCVAENDSYWAERTDESEDANVVRAPLSSSEEATSESQTVSAPTTTTEPQFDPDLYWSWSHTPTAHDAYWSFSDHRELTSSSSNNSERQGRLFENSQVPMVY